MTFFKIKLVNINPNDIASKANIPAFLVFLNISKITAITIKTIPLFPATVIPLNTGVKKDPALFKRLLAEFAKIHQTDLSIPSQIFSFAEI